MKVRKIKDKRKSQWIRIKKIKQTKINIHKAKVQYNRKQNIELGAINQRENENTGNKVGR